MADFDLGLQAQFKFQVLFNQLGWDKPPGQQPLRVDIGDHTYALEVVAHKRGVQIFHCGPDARRLIPDYAVRQKIDRKVTVEAREHLIIFSDVAKTTQVWQWVARAPGRPSQYREVRWRRGESAELLRQKLNAIAFTIEDEELLLVTDVTRKLAGGFDRDKVTKKFYTEFDAQRLAFTDFIAGIPHVVKNMAEDQRWYAAVLIDRLMFLWFLQEKLFLNGHKHYLRERLQAHLQSEAATSFYRAFLCPLFFRGFAEQRTETNRAAIETEFGHVPYLNGGLFAQHELERRYGAALDVEDAAFSKLFGFFDQWDWHLDDRPLGSGKEINPDVLGYIFEKFVNAKENAKGAYYTKEDITDYLGKNTIIPSLLAKVRAEHEKAFDGLVRSMLKESGDAYIYPAMLKGMPPLPRVGEGWGEGVGAGLPAYPADIANGLDIDAADLLERRKHWNKRANDALSLPTEIWREAIARHQRTREVRAKIAAGELRDVGDLITYNLDIRLFAQQLIERCTDVALLKSFWFALAGRLPQKSNERYRHGLSVLDPTCGSGAFLLAALNILKPLYDVTLRAMHAIRNDVLISGIKGHAETWKEIDAILARFATDRPDRAHDYAVTKHIIVHNLYGVDIEEQATEIAKLRLFLKLIALLEPGDDIEPLPDIDFNIRHGNTLVGYATEEQTKRAVMESSRSQTVSQMRMFGEAAWDDIAPNFKVVSEKYKNFQLQQLQLGGHVSTDDKRGLERAIEELQETLNHHLAQEYGIDPAKLKKYDAWKMSHQPFHWYVDFYPLMQAGGFDAVIGNPPWKEYAAVKAEYEVLGYTSIESGNLYGLCTERAIQIAAVNARSSFIGFIVQLPLASASRMQELRTLIEQSAASLWIATFDDRPGKLFEGLQHCRSTIFISQKDIQPRERHKLFSRYQRWPTEARAEMLTTMKYAENALGETLDGAWPKADDQNVLSVLTRLLTLDCHPLSRYRRPTQSENFVYYQEAAQYWVKATSHVPFYSKNGQVSNPSHGRWLYFETAELAFIAAAVLNSNLFYVYFVTFGDCFHVTDGLVSSFRVPSSAMEDDCLARLGERLMKKLHQGALRKTIRSRQGGTIDHIEYDEYSASDCKPLIDEIDVRLAQHYKLSAIELDAICAFDQKFRIGASETDD